MAPSAFQCAFDVYSLEPTLHSAVTALENVREAVAPAHDEKEQDEAYFHCPGVSDRAGIQRVGPGEWPVRHQYRGGHGEHRRWWTRSGGSDRLDPRHDVR